jgi:hypothetical protein
MTWKGPVAGDMATGPGRMNITMKGMGIPMNNYPMAEAKVQVRELGGEWRDALDFDPIMIPVIEYAGGTAPILTDVSNDAVIRLVDQLGELEMLPMHNLPSDILEYNLVWSDTGFSVKGVCPMCDDVFSVAEGAPGDIIEDGPDAVVCGCVDD